MFSNRSIFILAVILGLACCYADDSTVKESSSMISDGTIVETVNHLTQLNGSYPVGRKINFPLSNSEESMAQNNTAGLRVKFPPRAFKTRTLASHQTRNETLASHKNNLSVLRNLHPILAQKLGNITTESINNSSKVLEDRSEVDATINELISEKLARLEKMLVEELMVAYTNISREATLKIKNEKQNDSRESPFRIVVAPVKTIENKEGTMKNEILENPLNTTHVMTITKNNINAEQIKHLREKEITRGFQDFGRKITQKRESVENDLEAIETSSRFKAPETYQTGFRPIVRRDLSVVGPIPRGFGGMRSLDSTYDGIHSGEIPPPMWPSPLFSMGVAAGAEQAQQRAKVEESPSLELLLYKYEEALKQYHEAVSSYKKYYDKYQMYNERV